MVVVETAAMAVDVAVVVAVALSVRSFSLLQFYTFKILTYFTAGGFTSSNSAPLGNRRF